MALLKAFNPHDLSAGVVLGVATGREKPLEQILTAVRQNLNAPILQHMIISAPRGYGKSFLLRYIEVKIAELADSEDLPVVMALLPEELPHVKEPDTLIAEIKRTFLNEPADTVGVRWTEDDGAWDDMIAELDRSISERFGARSGLLIAGVENFDILIKKAFAKPLQSARLREFLTRPGNRVMLLAASARGAFDRNYDLPLFQVFEEIALTPWTIKQTIEFLIAQRRTAGKLPFSKTQLAKASAVATFISGTPRLATLIGEALLEDDLLGAADLLEKIVDELTPYYKERIEVLPARSQALLDALLRGGENCSVTALAKRVQAPSQAAIAAPLEDLKKDLVILGQKAPDSAEVLLRVADRVFAHFYRKRILSHGAEVCPLEALVEILALIYSPEEKRREADKFAARGLVREAALMTRLWEADNQLIKSKAIENRSSSEFGKSLKEWRRLTDAGEFAKSLSIINQALDLTRANKLEQSLSSKVIYLQAWTTAKLGRFEEALTTLRDVLDEAFRVKDIDLLLTAMDTIVWCLRQLGRHEEALVAARRAVAAAEETERPIDRLDALLSVAACLLSLDRSDEARVTAREVLVEAKVLNDIDREIRALVLVMSSSSKLNDQEEAVRSSLRAFELLQSSTNEEFFGKTRVLAAGALLVAAPPDAPKAISAYRMILEGTPLYLSDGPQVFFFSIATTLTRERAWPEFVNLMEEFPELADQIRESSDALDQPGRVIIELLIRARPEMTTQLTQFVAALSQGIDKGSDSRVARLWSAILIASVEIIVSTIEDVDILSQLTDTLNSHRTVPARAKSLSTAATSYHATGRDPLQLARLDPDLSTMITAAFPPAKSPKWKSRKVRKRS